MIDAAQAGVGTANISDLAAAADLDWGELAEVFESSCPSMSSLVRQPLAGRVQLGSGKQQDRGRHEQRYGDVSDAPVTDIGPLPQIRH